MSASVRPMDPPSRPSDEADRRQLELAKAEGARYMDALRYMIDEVAHTGDLQHAGDYLVGVAEEKAEGMYALEDGHLRWVEPGDANCHIEVAVLDATDHRFIPGLQIQAKLKNRDGEIAAFEVPFLWHPGLYHYGRNIKVPGPGRYDLEIRIDPPRFMRHDRVNGRRYAEPVSVTFEGLDIETGQD